MELSNKKINISGYTKQLLDYLMNNQFCDNHIYELFVDQYRLHPDFDNGWRGEFWGKLTRSACSTYKITKSKKLYDVLEHSVLDILTVQEDNGRVSSYPLEKEFESWDLWGRKYVMLGLIYFYDICKSQVIKKRIIKFLEKLADYIIARIGEGEHQKSIFKTSPIYGALNSCSILSPFVRLYKISKKERYLNFSKYLVDCGLCSSFNIIDAAFDDNLMPFEFKEKKAYELMSCYNGLLDYYEINNDKKYLDAVICFVDKLIKTDYTIIGCSGTDSEFLNNSSIKQTEDTNTFSQETCVTVTLMDLCKHLYDLTGFEKYLNIIEHSALNAYFGAINNENQTMANSRGLVWHGDDYYCPKHPSFPFDSYSPLVNYKRGYQVAGFMLMQNNESYGCCAAIGGFGMGIYLDSLLEIKNDTVSINLYDTYSSSFVVEDKKVLLSMKANVFSSNNYSIKIKCDNAKFDLRIRIPDWMKDPVVYVDGTKQNAVLNGFVTIDKVWTNNTINIKFNRTISPVYLNNKIAFTYGPIVLCSDERLNEDNNLLLNDQDFEFIFLDKTNRYINFNICSRIKDNNNKYYLVDYAQAGKNFDEEKSHVTVWLNTK